MKIRLPQTQVDLELGLNFTIFWLGGCYVSGYGREVQIKYLLGWVRHIGCAFGWDIQKGVC